MIPDRQSINSNSPAVKYRVTWLEHASTSFTETQYRLRPFHDGLLINTSIEICNPIVTKLSKNPGLPLLRRRTFTNLRNLRRLSHPLAKSGTQPRKALDKTRSLDPESIEKKGPLQERSTKNRQCPGHHLTQKYYLLQMSPSEPVPRGYKFREDPFQEGSTSHLRQCTSALSPCSHRQAGGRTIRFGWKHWPAATLRGVHHHPTMEFYRTSPAIFNQNPQQTGRQRPRRLFCSKGSARLSGTTSASQMSSSKFVAPARG
jgi:hypothetical protein